MELGNAGWRGRMEEMSMLDETEEGKRSVDWEGFEEGVCCRANCR